VQEVIANGFHLQQATDALDSSDVVKFFAKAKKEGKQIWYLTAPVNVPIEVVQETIIHKDKKGLPILTYNDNDYVASFEDSSMAPAIQLILPTKTGVKYTDRECRDSRRRIEGIGY